VGMSDKLQSDRPREKASRHEAEPINNPSELASWPEPALSQSEALTLLPYKTARVFRQAAARKIGATQGNRRLQSWMGEIQRRTSGQLDSTRSPDIQRDARTEALSQQLAFQREQALARVEGARHEAEEMFSSGQESLDEIVQTAQESLRSVSNWRRGVDRRALAELETSPEAQALSTGLELAWEITGDVIGAISSLHPAWKITYMVINYATILGGGISDAYQAAENARLASASGAAHRLSLTAQDNILQTILLTQRSAVSAFNRIFGALLNQVSSASGTALGGAEAVSEQEQRQLQERRRRPRREDVEDVEAAGLRIDDVAVRAEEHLSNLRLAHQVLQQAPETIRRESRQRLVALQLLFARSPARVQLHGRLIREGVDRRVLGIDPYIGEEERRTRLSLQSAWSDFRDMGIPVDLELDLQANVEEPGFFLSWGGRWGGVSVGHTATVHLLESGVVRWSGADEGVIGMLLVRDWSRPFGVEGLPPNRGGFGRQTPTPTPDDEAAGRTLRQQVEGILFSRPLEDLERTWI